MHIDCALPSNGIYNNPGSSRQLANYLEHEDLERIEKGLYTEDFFNLTDDNIRKLKVIKDIDSNIGQLLKTDASFTLFTSAHRKTNFGQWGTPNRRRAKQ